MCDSKYKDFLEQRHPELLKEAEDFFDVSDRGTWEYVCKLMPKLADLPHEKIESDTIHRDFGWYVYRDVTVGQRTAKVGIRLWVHTHKMVGDKYNYNWTKVKLNDDEHYIEFYTCFDHGSCSCYQTMTNLPGISCGDSNGNKYPVDIPSKRDQIYKYMGL